MVQTQADMGLEVGRGGVRATEFLARIKTWQHGKSAKEEHQENELQGLLFQD